VNGGWILCGGDASILMNNSRARTLSQYQLARKVVIINKRLAGMVRNGRKASTASAIRF